MPRGGGGDEIVCEAPNLQRSNVAKKGRRMWKKVKVGGKEREVEMDERGKRKERGECLTSHEE